MDLLFLVKHGAVIASWIEVGIAALAFYLSYRDEVKFQRTKQRKHRVWSILYVLLGSAALTSIYIILFA